jgi:sugar/nucleoside kinase (ribokinase family)
MMTKGFDVLALGCVAVDDLLYVPSFPVPDSKLRVRRSERQCGGGAATSLVTAARLGSQCAFACDLGEDELSAFVRERFHQEGIDISLLRTKAGVRPIHSTVIVDDAGLTRTILYDLEGAQGAPDDWPPVSSIQACRALRVDHFGTAGMIRAARIARDSGLPVIGDFERSEGPQFSELLALTDHLIISSPFAAALTGLSDPASIIDKLWSEERAIVGVTCGPEGCWYRSREEGQTVNHQPAFSVPAVDTTGCGDVFHGAYASALTRQMGSRDRILFASAAAALKAMHCGGQAGIPTLQAVEAFL